MTTRIPINIENTYITKPLHADTLVATLKEKSHHILHRLYLVTNGLKDRQPFLEIENEKYTVSANINIKHGYASDAKEQASTLKIMKPIISVRPEYTISFFIYEKVNMVELFKFRHTTTNKNEVYNLISTLENKIEDFI
jgi:hypothetical protein